MQSIRDRLKHHGNSNDPDKVYNEVSLLTQFKVPLDFRIMLSLVFFNSLWQELCAA